MIKHIVFDFGGVILDLDGVHTGYPNDLAEILSLPTSVAQDIWSTNKTNVMVGIESPRDFLDRIINQFNKSIDINQALDIWEMKNFIYRERIDWDLVSFIEDLSKGYAVHMLTDQIPLDNGAADWKHDYEQYFHTILRSYEQGFRKPDKIAYENMLSKINAQPNEVVFIDDNTMNIQSAQDLGIHGIQYVYRDKDALMMRLRELGVHME